MATSNSGHEAGEAGDGPGEPAAPGARLAEETRLLLDALAERAQPWLNRLAAGAEPGTDAAAEHTPATCGWCPVCAGLALARGERPELAVRAAEHAVGLLRAFRTALADPAAARPQASPPAAEPDASGDSGEAAEPGRVQKIAVRRKGASGTADEQGEQC